MVVIALDDCGRRLGQMAVDAALVVLIWGWQPVGVASALWILAIILDRLTQAVGRDSRSRGNRRWYTTGPVGLITRPFVK